MAKGDSRLIINCPKQCQFHPDTIGMGAAQAIAAVRANGAGRSILQGRIEEILGHRVNSSSVSRHLNHYREPLADVDDVIDPKRKLADLEILDLVIQRGAANSASWRPSIKDTLDAMKLKTQMTGNSAFDDLIALFDAADEEDGEPIEAPEAVADEEEREILEDILIDD